MTRKPFHQDTGKHTAKPPSPHVDIFDPPTVDVFAEECKVCKAKPGEPCTSIMGTHKERSYPHPARTEAARSKQP
jgi:hypothetical protein